MSEDAFHLTPRDVRAQEFGRAFRGCDPVEVEEFKSRVADELERLMRERSQLEERVRGLQEQLRAFRERERAMNEALVAAQQLRAESREQAAREAELIVREARAEAARVVAAAEHEERAFRDRTERVARQFAAYVASYRALLERELAEVDALEAHARASVEFHATGGPDPAAGTVPEEPAA
ncbi:MAG TPA: DivIVA domain-containing protein [Gemmatimonadales bacterium]|nr:DivIVA domain-containing protein [Gemmatimonadales bacterium]